MEDARDLFADLQERLEKLETMLTTRWRRIAILMRQRPPSSIPQFVNPLRPRRRPLHDVLPNAGNSKLCGLRINRVLDSTAARWEGSRMGRWSRAKKYFFIICVCALNSCGGTPNPDATINHAYNWYVRTLKSGEDPLLRARTGLRPFATDRFLTSVQSLRSSLESNALLDPQSFDARLGVENVETKGAAATARVVLTGHTIGKQTLNVFLVREETGWKIDDVKLIDDGSGF